MPFTQSRFIQLFTRFIIAIIALFLLLLVSIWIASPLIIRDQANSYLEPLGFQLNESASVRFNPFALSVTLANIELTDKASETVYARVKNGYVNIKAFPLFQQLVVFERLYFGGLYIEADRQQEMIKIAGFDLSETETKTANDEQNTSNETDWRIDIKEFLLEDFEALLIDNQKNHTVHLNALTLKDLFMQAAGQRGHIDITAELNGAGLKTQLDFDLRESEGTVNIEFKLDELQLGRFDYLVEKHLDQAETEISLQFVNTVSIRDNGLSMALSNARLTLEHTDLTASGFRLKNNRSELSISDTNLAIENGALSSLNGMINLSIGKTNLRTKAHPHQLLIFDELKMPESALSVDKDQQYDFASEQIKLLNMVVSQAVSAPENKNADLPALLAIQAISMDNIKLTPDLLTLDRILLSGFESSLVLDKNRNLANLVPFSDDTHEQETPQTEPTPASEQTTEEGTFALTLGKFELDQPGSITVIDQGIESEYERRYTVDTLRLENVQTADKTNSSPFALALNSDKYTKISADGDLKLFSDKTNLALEATIREFSLPRISPFVRQAAGFDMLSGQLDSDIKLSVVEDEITGNTALTMRGLEISTADDVKTGSLSEQSFIPLNIALGALKDGDGTINMDVPLSGNVNDPDFGVSGFMSLIAQKAALSASQSYLLTTFVPYANVISLTQMVGEFALKVRIDDLIYRAGQTQLETTQSEFSQSIIALLEDKEDMSLKLCAIATKDDLNEPGIDITDAKTIARLKELAQQRGDIFKDQLVEQGGVSSSRLLLCQPKIDGQDDALPRIEFNI